MKQQLRKPENWQDFEELCKMLWSEIWLCPETKKNGRSGQEQQGVDVYGTPSWELAEYYGIQCKGKDEYSHAQLTEKEIDTEIEKAKYFQPKLKKFYFATTANKDAKIEEYIRKKDVLSRKSGCFEIHLFSWEEIVNLIDQNKRTHDWYVRKINFKTLYAVTVLFQNKQTVLNCNPIIVRNAVKYRVKKTDSIFTGRYFRSPEYIRKDMLEILTEAQPKRYFMNGTSYNKSSSVFSLVIANTGDSVLENFRFYFEFLDSQILADTVTKGDYFLDLFKYKYNTFINADTLKGTFEPADSVLVQNDSVITDELCIRPTSEVPQVIKINWRLVAKDFSATGQLTINLNTVVKEKSEIEEYEYPLEDEIRLENYTGE